VIDKVTVQATGLPGYGKEKKGFFFHD